MNRSHSIRAVAARLRHRPLPTSSDGGPEWLEIRFALFPHPVDRRFVAWSELGETLDNWRAEQRFRWCFFVRKPPGLRLRFGGDDLASRLEPVLFPWLADAERRNDVRGFRVTVYEPETARFGGPVGMAIAHQAFDGDSRDAIGYETMSVEQRLGLSRPIFSLAACSDLFRRSLGDHAEIWDVWQRLRRAVPEPQRPPGTAVLSTLELQRVVSGRAPDLRNLNADARSLLERRFDDNRRTASAIVAARDAGRLTVGLRSWLAAFTIFHWNRFGLVLAVDDLSALISEICRILAPDA